MTLGKTIAVRSALLIAALLYCTLAFAQEPQTSFRLRAVAEGATCAGHGFVVKGLNPASGDLLLVTALHVLRDETFVATSLEVLSNTGTNQLIDPLRYRMWPEFDLAAIPVSGELASRLNARILEVAPPGQLVDLGASLVLSDAALSGVFVGDSQVGALVESIEIGSGRSTQAFESMARDARVVLYKMRTKGGMSGAPVILGGNQVVAVHLQGAPETDRYHELGFGLNLAEVTLGSGLPSEAGGSAYRRPNLAQSEVQYLPEDILQRLKKAQELVAVAPEGGGTLSVVGVHAMLSAPIVSQDPFGTWRVAGVGDFIARNSISVETGATGVGLNVVLGMGYAHLARETDGREFVSHALWVRAGAGPGWYSVDLEEMTGWTLSLNPVLDILGIGLSFGKDPRESHYGYGGLLSLRYASLHQHVALVVHTALLSQPAAVRRPDREGRELSLDVGLGVGPVF
jgi:hypothetical protein